MVKNEANHNHETSIAQIILAGATIGALIGAGAAYLMIQKAEREQRALHVGTGDGIKLGLLALGLLRQVAQLGEGD